MEKIDRDSFFEICKITTLILGALFFGSDEYSPSRLETAHGGFYRSPFQQLPVLDSSQFKF